MCFVFRSVLEKSLKLLMECVDDLSQDANKFFNYQRTHAKYQHGKQQALQKRVRTFDSFPQMLCQQQKEAARKTSKQGRRYFRRNSEFLLRSVSDFSKWKTRRELRGVTSQSRRRTSTKTSRLQRHRHASTASCCPARSIATPTKSQSSPHRASENSSWLMLCRVKVKTSRHRKQRQASNTQIVVGLFHEKPSVSMAVGTRSVAK